MGPTPVVRGRTTIAHSAVVVGRVSCEMGACAGSCLATHLSALRPPRRLTAGLTTPLALATEVIARLLSLAVVAGALLPSLVTAPSLSARLLIVPCTERRAACKAGVRAFT